MHGLRKAIPKSAYHYSQRQILIYFNRVFFYSLIPTVTTLIRGKLTLKISNAGIGKSDVICGTKEKTSFSIKKTTGNWCSSGESPLMTYHEEDETEKGKEDVMYMSS